MPRYRIITLVDITRTYTTRQDTDVKKISQQANFNSLIQAIGMRANPQWITDPQKNNGRFPEPFEGKGSYWIWEFETEREDVFLSNNDPVGLLKNDIKDVPIIDNLENTALIQPCIFQPSGSGINIFVEEII